MTRLSFGQESHSSNPFVFGMGTTRLSFGQESHSSNPFIDNAYVDFAILNALSIYSAKSFHQPAL